MIQVIKYGGTSIQTIEKCLLKQPLVLVHGGGIEISLLCQKLKITPRFIEGMRVTDKETLAIVQMVLGKITAEIVSSLKKIGFKAIGVSGVIEATCKNEALGLVGEISAIDAALLHQLLNEGYLPVIAPIAYDKQGQAYNVNADMAAAHISIALRAHILNFVTDVEGVFRDLKDPMTKIATLSLKEIENLSFDGGMIPKLKAAAIAVKGAVPSVFVGQTEVIL